MSTRMINRLIQAVVILSIVYALVLFGQGRQTDSGIATPANLTGLKTAADRFVIKTGSDTVELERAGDRWLIGKKKVKATKASDILNALEALEFARVVSSDEGDSGQYGLDEGEAKSISVYDGKKRLRTIAIGRATNSGRFYAKLGGKSVIYEAEGELLTILEEPTSEWTEAEKKTRREPDEKAPKD